MRRIGIMMLVLYVTSNFCNSQQSENSKKTVKVFSGHGGSKPGFDTLSFCAKDVLLKKLLTNFGYFSVRNGGDEIVSTSL